MVEDVRSLTESGLAILMLAGLWPLKACRIEGTFDVYQIAGLLPQTLHHLHVELDLYHRDFDKIDICIFQRFRSLRSLHLSAEEGQGASFLMQSSMALPNLRHLHLSPWPLKDNGMLADSFPQLTHAALHVHAIELEQYVMLPHIDYLSLQLVSLTNEAVQVKVKVDADSHLNCLVLSVPENVKVDLCLDKPDLLFAIHSTSTASAHGISSVCSPANLKRVYQLPKHFTTL